MGENYETILRKMSTQLVQMANLGVGSLSIENSVGEIYNDWSMSGHSKWSTISAGQRFIVLKKNLRKPSDIVLQKEVCYVGT